LPEKPSLSSQPEGDELACSPKVRAAHEEGEKFNTGKMWAGGMK